MKDEQFDKLIKHRLQDYASGVPENMWERIAGKEKDRKRGPGLRHYLLGIALLLIGLSSVYLVTIYTRPAASNTQTSTLQQVAHNMQSTPTKNSVLHPSTTNGTVATNNQKSKVEINENTSTQSVETTNPQESLPVVQNKTVTDAAAKSTADKRMVYGTLKRKSLSHRGAEKQYGYLKKLPASKIKPVPQTVTHNTEENNAQLKQKLHETLVTPLSTKKTGVTKPDSAQATPIAVTNALLLRAGLQWNLLLPLAGSAHYFAGAPGSAGAYAALVPGGWLSLTADRSSFTLEVQPLSAALLKEIPFYSLQQNTDSTTTLTTTKTLLKTFGLAAGLQYHYNLNSNWWIGGGVQGMWWKKGLIATTSTVEKRDASNHVSVSETTELKSVPINSTDVPDFVKFQLFTNADLLYKSRRWEAGVRTGVSFMPLAQKEGPKNQLQASLFFRLCLFQKQVATH